METVIREKCRKERKADGVITTINQGKGTLVVLSTMRLMATDAITFCLELSTKETGAAG